MGSKGTVQLPQSQNTSSSVTPNPVALAAYSDLVGRAQGVGSTPYQPYGGPLVQGFSPQQNRAFDEVGGLQGAAQPYIDRGAGLAMAGATAADPTHFAGNVGAYMSPFTDDVVNATMANINETNAQQQNDVVGNAIAKGAMGGDRVGVAQAELAREQNLSNNQTIAGLRNTGFQNATAELNAGAAAQGQGAYSLGALGNEAQSTGLQGANALLQTGGLQQQLGQANLSTAYQQFLNSQAYPFQNLSWLSGIINGTGPNMGSSSTGASQGYTSQLAPNSLNSVLGLGTAALGLFSDERVKEDIREVGKLHDGQKIYRFRYKGQPEFHVGLLAQEVEKHHPEAVGSLGGVKTVEYGQATEDAGRTHKAGGGGLSGIPYADFASSGGFGGLPTSGYVPAPQPIAAHGLQLPAAPQLQQPHANSGQASQDIKLPSSSDLSKAGKGLGNLGSGIGDYLSADNHDYASDLAGGVAPLARGGGVRRGYADGGVPDFDPDVLARNSQWSLPAGSGYQTPLSADEQPQFDAWVKGNNVPFRASPTADYDMPGYWKSLQSGDGRAASGLNANDGQMHFTDYFKTPYHKSFSAESKFATAGAPSWNDRDQLVAPNGSIVFDERAMRGLGGAARRSYDDGGTVADDDFSGGLGALIEGRSADDPYATRRYAQESGGRQFKDDGSPVISPKGAAGIAQVMPSTGPEAAGLAGLPWDENRFYGDEKYNKALGDAYYAKQYADFGDHDKALAAYNAGPGRLSMALARAEKEGGDWRAYLPAETRNYVANITGSQDGGLGAIQSATQGDTSSGGLGEGRSADDGTTASPSTGGLGGVLGKINVLGLPDNARTALIAAGLGMAASKSHWVGPAIGEGGLAGIKAYETQQKTGIAQQTANQSGENIKSEIATRKGQLTLQNRQQDIVEQKLKALMDAASATQRSILGGSDAPISGAGATGAPAVPAIGAPRQLGPSAGTPAPASAAGASPASGGDNQAPAANAPPQLAPFSDPVHLDRQASLYEAAAAKVAIDPAAQRNYMTQAQQARQTAAAIRASGKGVTVDGRVVPLPGALETASAEEGAKTEGRLKAEAPYDLKEVTPIPGGPSYYQSKADILAQNGQKQSVPVLSSPGAGTPTSGAPPANPAIAKQPAFIATKQEEMAKNEQKMGEAYQVRQVAAERLQTLSDVLSKYQTGKFAEGKAEFVAALRGVGIPVPSSATANPAAFEQFIKNATANVFSQVKDMGGRVLVAEILGLTKANANPEMQPEANKAILGQAVGLLKYEDAYHDAYFDWKRQNPYAFDSSAFDTQWVKGNPVRGFVTGATKDIGARGEQIPAAADRVQGQVYSNAKGQKARWNGSGWQPVAGNP